MLESLSVRGMWPAQEMINFSCLLICEVCVCVVPALVIDFYVSSNTSGIELLV